MMQSINHNSPSLIYVKDLEGRYLMVNEAFERSVGRPESELIGRSDEIFSPELATVWRAADDRAREGRYEVEEVRDDPDGRHYFQSIKFPVRNAEGVIYATCGVSLDVTELKRTNAALAKTRDAALAAAAAKSTFLATMSHEIRTPMNAVIGMTDLLLDTRLDEQQRDFVGTIRSSGDALLAVINDILDFSKIESGELNLTAAPFVLREEVENAVELVAAAAVDKHLDLVSYIDDSCPPMVVGDAGRLRQILINLLSNAVKFTPRGDVLLTVSSRPAANGRLELSFEVADTGIGISPEGLDKLFTSFSQVDTSSTRSYGGTGLGLAISRRLAQAMDGDIAVRSVVDEGSTFTVTVLLDPYAADGAHRPEPDPAVAGTSVLIVDDNATNLRILDLQLTGRSMRTTTAPTPADALTAVAQGRAFDIAVLDLHMPGMDGVQLAHALRRLPAFGDTPIILLTSVGDRPPDLERHFAAVITKPVKSAVLEAALASALNTGEPGPLGEAAAPAPAAVPDHRLRILLAEDNLVNQRVAQLMLAKLGHQVDTVPNGAEAVDAVLRTPYDVVLMDVQMPQMDGLEATRQIRSRLPAEQQPHIIAMTASALLEDQRACSAAGMESYLTKPVRAAELGDLLERVAVTIHRKPAAAPAATTNGHHVAAGSAGEPAAVDVEVLTNLRADLDDADGTVVDDLVDTYLTSAATLVPDLTSALAEGDTARAAALAHALSSPTTLVGARTLAALLQQAQRVAREPADLPDLERRIAKEYPRVVEDLRRVLAERAPAGASALSADG
jgi:PAS domain S-box-containing protein